jgi:choline dehydrogenase
MDYIIVGGGTAGCVLAHRLTEDRDVSVLLLEAGGQPDHPEIRIPARWFNLMGTHLDWHFFSEPQPHADQRALVWNRGRALGGSSTINAMLYIRGHAWDFNHWHELGNPGWSYTEVLPYFKKSERNARGASPYHGADGLLHVVDHAVTHPISHVFIEAGQEFGLPLNDDFNGESQDGVGWYQATQKDGERHSAYDAFLQPALSRVNLTVDTYAQVTRILFESGRAVGVEYIQDNCLRQARADRDVILCGGAIHSPQLLLCSGIGASSQLEAFSIPVVVDLPGVGENLQDHPKVDLHFTSRSMTRRDFSLTSPAYAEYMAERGGILSVIRSQVGAFVRTRAGLPIPDVQLYAAVAGADNPFDFALVASLLRPRASGRVRLRSANPLVPPAIEPDFLADADDLRTLIDSVKLIRGLVQTRAFADFLDTEVNPGESVQSDEQIAAWVRSAVESTWHCSSTCKMGMDAAAVVDPQLLVRGVDGLRVVDASIMPTTIGGNTNAAVLMIAEKAADMIRAG